MIFAKFLSDGILHISSYVIDLVLTSAVLFIVFSIYWTIDMMIPLLDCYFYLKRPCTFTKFSVIDFMYVIRSAISFVFGVLVCLITIYSKANRLNIKEYPNFRFIKKSLLLATLMITAILTCSSNRPLADYLTLSPIVFFLCIETEDPVHYSLYLHTAISAASIVGVLFLHAFLNAFAVNVDPNLWNRTDEIRVIPLSLFRTLFSLVVAYFFIAFIHYFTSNLCDGVRKSILHLHQSATRTLNTLPIGLALIQYMYVDKNEFKTILQNEHGENSKTDNIDGMWMRGKCFFSNQIATQLFKNLIEERNSTDDQLRQDTISLSPFGFESSNDFAKLLVAAKQKVDIHETNLDIKKKKKNNSFFKCLKALLCNPNQVFLTSPTDDLNVGGFKEDKKLLCTMKETVQGYYDSKHYSSRFPEGDCEQFMKNKQNENFDDSNKNAKKNLFEKENDFWIGQMFKKLSKDKKKFSIFDFHEGDEHCVFCELSINDRSDLKVVREFEISCRWIANDIDETPGTYYGKRIIENGALLLSIRDITRERRAWDGRDAYLNASLNEIFDALEGTAMSLNHSLELIMKEENLENKNEVLDQLYNSKFAIQIQRMFLTDIRQIFGNSGLLSSLNPLSPATASIFQLSDLLLTTLQPFEHLCKMNGNKLVGEIDDPLLSIFFFDDDTRIAKILFNLVSVVNSVVRKDTINLKVILLSIYDGPSDASLLDMSATHPFAVGEIFEHQEIKKKTSKYDAFFTPISQTTDNSKKKLRKKIGKIGIRKKNTISDAICKGHIFNFNKKNSFNSWNQQNLSISSESKNCFSSPISPLTTPVQGSQTNDHVSVNMDANSTTNDTKNLLVLDASNVHGKVEKEYAVQIPKVATVVHSKPKDKTNMNSKIKIPQKSASNIDNSSVPNKINFPNNLIESKITKDSFLTSNIDVRSNIATNFQDDKKNIIEKILEGRRRIFDYKIKKQQKKNLVKNILHNKYYRKFLSLQELKTDSRKYSEFNEKFSTIVFQISFNGNLINPHEENLLQNWSSLLDDFIKHQKNNPGKFAREYLFAILNLIPPNFHSIILSMFAAKICNGEISVHYNKLDVNKQDIVFAINTRLAENVSNKVSNESIYLNSKKHEFVIGDVEQNKNLLISTVAQSELYGMGKWSKETSKMREQEKVISSKLQVDSNIKDNSQNDFRNKIKSLKTDRENEIMSLQKNFDVFKEYYDEAVVKLDKKRDGIEYTGTQEANHNKAESAVTLRTDISDVKNLDVERISNNNSINDAKQLLELYIEKANTKFDESMKLTLANKIIAYIQNELRFSDTSINAPINIKTHQDSLSSNYDDHLKPNIVHIPPLSHQDTKSSKFHEHDEDKYKLEESKKSHIFDFVTKILSPRVKYRTSMTSHNSENSSFVPSPILNQNTAPNRTDDLVIDNSIMQAIEKLSEINDKSDINRKTPRIQKRISGSHIEAVQKEKKDEKKPIDSISRSHSTRIVNFANNANNNITSNIGNQILSSTSSSNKEHKALNNTLVSTPGSMNTTTFDSRNETGVTVFSSKMNKKLIEYSRNMPTNILDAANVSYSTLRVLLVEDNIFNINAICHILKTKLNIKKMCAVTNGPEAIYLMETNILPPVSALRTFAEEEKWNMNNRTVDELSEAEIKKCLLERRYNSYTLPLFDVILLDVHLPGIKGFEVAKKIRELEKSRNVCPAFLSALSVDNSPDIHIDCLNSGIDAFLLKPIHAYQLEELFLAATNILSVRLPDEPSKIK